MTLYDIDNEIEQATTKVLEVFDEETGEVSDIDAFEALKAELDALQTARDTKLSNIACLIKAYTAEEKAIREEAAKLQKKAQAAANKTENLKKYLAYALNGEKFKDARCSVYYHPSKAVTFAEGFDIESLPEEYVKITKEARKTELKKAIEAGESFEGCSIEERTSLVVK